MRRTLLLGEMSWVWKRPAGVILEEVLKQISWGEAALLAVLPNAPSLIHPGKNRNQLKEKRDRLLDKLVATGKIDAFTGVAR